MAKTSFARSDALSVEWWASATFKYGVYDNFFNKKGFIGKNMPKNKSLKGVSIESDPNAMITRKMEFNEHQKGDFVTYALIDPLSGAGVIDDEQLEDNEEALSAHDFSITLRRRRHATRSTGQLSDLRPAFDVKQKSKMVLGMWLAREHDKDIIAAGSGVANSVGTIAAAAPTSTRRWYGGQTAAGVVESVANDAAVDSATTNLFGEKVIEWVKRFATLNEPIIRPIIIGGEEIYIMLVHPYQSKALRASTDYVAAMQNAMQRAQDNPLFKGMFATSKGVWDGVLVHEIPRMETRLGAGGSTAAEYFELGDDVPSGITCARALFCGAQAMCVAYKGTPSWVEDKFDYENEWGIALGLFYQVAKTKFNSIDYGVVTVDCAVAVD